MSNKIKKNKNKQKDFPKEKENEILKDSDDNSDDQTNSSIGNKEQIFNKRKNTKYVKRNKNKIQKEEIKEENLNKKKRVKFGDIQIINVECWKKINLKLTSEENFDELIKMAEGKNYGRMKNIGCTCLII